MIHSWKVFHSSKFHVESLDWSYRVMQASAFSLVKNLVLFTPTQKAFCRSAADTEVLSESLPNWAKRLNNFCRSSLSLALLLTVALKAGFSDIARLLPCSALLEVSLPIPSSHHQHQFS